MTRGDAIVLGAAGFVGRHVARALAEAGWRVLGIGHGDWSREQWSAWGISTWYDGDVDLKTLVTLAATPDLVVQCAGSGSVAASFGDPLRDFERSVATTLATLEFVRIHAPDCRIVLPSSAAVYGSVATMPIAITTPRRPASPYGAHKAIAEDLCGSYARSFGVRAAIVRLFSVYGPGLRKQLLWDACGKLSHGEAVFGGTGEERRDWLHVDDAAALLVRAADHASADCPIVNGGCGRSASIREIVTMLGAALGGNATARFSGERRSGDPDVYEADTSEATAWDWRPTRALDEGISGYAAWYAAGGSAE